MLSYKPVSATIIQVLLDDKIIGEIRTVEGGFQYFAKGERKGGEVFPTLGACKRSLQD